MVINEKKGEMVLFKMTPVINFSSEEKTFFNFFKFYQIYKASNESVQTKNFKQFEYINDYTIGHIVFKELHIFIQEKKFEEEGKI